MGKKAGNPRVEELVRLISRHQELYYNAQPEISDEDFDSLWSELEDLDPENPLLAKVGQDKADGWPKATHLIPMGSQAKAADQDAFLAWARKMNFDRYLVQYKLDGASLELQYSDGRLVRAVTRGDGAIGDDITPNARKMKGVLETLPVPFSGGVRGEVLMSRSIHRARYADKANCRNAANGLMKRKDGTGSEDLEVICYDASGEVSMNHPVDLFGMGEAQGLASSPFLDELGKIEWLGAMGFTAVRTEIFSTPEEVVEFRAHTMSERAGMDYDIDGLVIKSALIDPEDLAKPRPDKQIAFKFNLEEAVTTLRDIEWSESGSLYTPIGIVDPVRLAGTTVQRANLCNPDMIRGLNLKIGSLVIITKRGEIIPKIESLVENPESSKAIEMPTACATCGTPLVDEGTRLFCPNETCPKKELHRVEKWLGILDIRGFGTALAQRLHEMGRVRSIADLYSLTVEELENLDRMGTTLATKLIKNLRSVRELELSEFLAGFDLEGVGLLVAEKLTRAYPSLDSLLAAKAEDLVKIDGIAETMASLIVNGLAAVREEMGAVLASGEITIRNPAPKVDTLPDDPVAGKSFCFTGELVSMKRPDAEKAIRMRGGTAKSSVTKDLDYLVTNDPSSGSGKNAKAKEYGIPILDENEFLSLLNR